MTVYYGGTIISMEEDQMFPEAVVIDGEKIAYTGSLEEAKKAFPEAELRSLNGKTLMPGFIDTHCHVSFAGENKTQPSVFYCTSVQEVLDFIRAQSETMKEGDVLFINGYAGMPIKEERNLTLEEMDNALPDFPLILRTASTHGTLVNTRALNIIRAEAKKAGFELDPQDEKEGFLRNRANLLASGLGPKLMSREQKKKALAYILEECSKNGITAVHTLEGRTQKDDPDVLALMALRDSLPFDVRICYQTTDVEEVVSKGLKQIGGCFNCILDGDLDPHTAALREPYFDAPDNRGVLYFTDEELEDFFIKANRAGLQICMHAIGDRAIEQALNAYEKALADTPRKDHRHRIDHFEISAPDLIEKAKKLGVVLAMQPVFDYYWPKPGYAAVIGDERADWKCALAPVLKAGLKAGAGSDWPVTSINPFLGIHGAVNHSVESSRISVMDALRMYTVDAAYIGFSENVRGSLKSGKEASMVILSDNPLEHDRDKLDRIQVLETVYKGRTVWKKEETI